MSNKPLPHDEGIERNIIAAIMTEPYLIDKALNAGVVEDMFHNNALKLVWSTSVKLFGTGGHVDVVLLSDAFKGSANALSGNIEYFLVGLQSSIATTAGFKDWLVILKKHYASRLIKKACNIADGKIDGNEPISRIITDLQDELVTAENIIGGKERVSTGTLLRSVIDEMKEGLTGKNEIVPICIPGTEFLKTRKKGLHILGAMPGTGKTAFALNSMLKRAEAGYRDSLFCAETSAKAIMRRLISIESEIPIELFDDMKKMTAKQIERYKNAIAKIDSLKDKMYIFGKGDYKHTPDGIRAELKRIQDETAGELDAVTVDYLQNMRATGTLAKASRTEQIEDFIFRLNETFGEFNLAATVLCQLSRDKDRAKANRAPGIYDLKGSSAIEQEADYITFLHKKHTQDSGSIYIKWYSEKVRGSQFINTELLYNTAISSYLHRYSTEYDKT